MKDIIPKKKVFSSMLVKLILIPKIAHFNTTNGKELNLRMKRELLKKWVDKIRQGIPLEKIEEEVDKNYSPYRYFLQEKPLLQKELEEQTLINYYREKTSFLLQQGKKKIEDLLEENKKKKSFLFLFS